MNTSSNYAHSAIDRIASMPAPTRVPLEAPHPTPLAWRLRQALESTAAGR